MAARRSNHRVGSFGKTIVVRAGPGSAAVETFVITSTGVKQTPIGGVFDILFNSDVYV